MLMHCYRNQNRITDVMTKDRVKSANFNETRLFVVPSMYAYEAMWTNISEFILKSILLLLLILVYCKMCIKT